MGGKKNCFLLTCASTSMYFAAARPEILVKWFNAIDQAPAWYEPSKELETEAELSPERSGLTPPESTHTSHAMKRAAQPRSKSNTSTPEVPSDSPRAVRFSELPPS